MWILPFTLLCVLNVAELYFSPKYSGLSTFAQIFNIHFACPQMSPMFAFISIKSHTTTAVDVKNIRFLRKLTELVTYTIITQKSFIAAATVFNQSWRNFITINFSVDCY